MVSWQLHEAATGSRCVNIRGLAGNQQENEEGGMRSKLTPLVTKVASKRGVEPEDHEPEDDDCPPLIY